MAVLEFGLGRLLGAALVLLLTAAAYRDARTRRVSNAWTLPPLGIALVWRGGQTLWGAQSGGFLIATVLGALLIQVGWWGRLYGGADAKLFGALWLLWPTVTWLYFWLFSLLLGYVGYQLTSDDVRQPPALIPAAMAAWLYFSLHWFST